MHLEGFGLVRFCSDWLGFVWESGELRVKGRGSRVWVPRVVLQPVHVRRLTDKTYGPVRGTPYPFHCRTTSTGAWSLAIGSSKTSTDTTFQGSDLRKRT